MQNKKCFRKTKAERILCQQGDSTRNVNENSWQKKIDYMETKFYTNK